MMASDDRMIHASRPDSFGDRYVKSQQLQRALQLLLL
jgi:hypothetical protein